MAADPFAQAGYDARLEWGPHGIRRLAPACDVIVIVDVLSFSTAVDVAVGRGAEVLPYRWQDKKEAAFAEHHHAFLAGGRAGAGADQPFCLSPSSLLALPPGSRLVLPSPNGSALAFGAAEAGASAVFAGCLRNAAAVAAAARAAGKTVGVVAAGERWHGATGPLRPALEDLLGAGAVLSALGAASPSPEARAAMAAFAEATDDLPARLAGCGSGRQLIAAGYEADVELAAALDASPVAPQLVGLAFTGRGRGSPA
jgi:2-phosphosulfolactate phosphatase